jgi:membrane-associated phospholipid phosphatase
MGDRMIAWARADGFDTPWNGLPPADPLGGGWVGAKDAAGNFLPHAGFQIPAMTPYYLVSPGPGRSRQSQFRPAPPPAVGSDLFNEGIAVTRAAALARTTADIAFANYWNLNTNTVTALGYWDQLASDYIDAAGLDEREASHIFALMNSATLDAVIGCWEAKYHYVFLRPSMADASISRAPGIPATATSPAFPYGLPNHPSYPSGHSCVSAAAVQVLAKSFPLEAGFLNIQVGEAGRSRVVGGIHYPFDVVAGQELGRSVAEWAVAYDKQPGGLLRAIP